MNLNEKNLELQVQIWALVGPVIALMTVITLFFQGSPQNMTLSTAVLAGTLACWWWKTKGLMGGILGVSALQAYQYFNHQLEDPIWNLGMTCAIALTFLVTALSFEEVEAIVGGMQSESTSRLKSLLKLDEKLENVQLRLQEEKKSLLNRIRESDQELQHQGRLIEISRDEIIAIHQKNEELLAEIHALKMEQKDKNPYEWMECANDEALKEIEELRKELTLTEDRLISTARNAIQEQEELKALHATIENEYKLKLQELQEKVSVLQAENETPKEAVESREYRRVLGMYNQLRSQFEEKSKILDDTRRELFVAQEQLTHELMSRREKQYEGTELEKELQRCLFELEKEYAEALAAHRKETEELQDIISKLYLS